MLTLLLLACAPFATMAPPDPFADPGSHTLGARVNGGVAIPDLYPLVSPQLWYVGHPNPRLEWGASAFIGARGTDWPRQINRGGAGGYLRYYARSRESSALGLQIESTGASYALGGVGVLSLAPQWSAYTAPGLGVDLGVSTGGEGGSSLSRGVFVRVPVGVGYTREKLHFGFELDAVWSPFTNPMPTTIDTAHARVDPPPTLGLQGGLSLSWTLPQQTP